MDHQPEQFEQLQRLLKLKRHEQPPPGYFNRFSAQVMARIEVELREQPSWLERFWLAFETRPALAASYGILVGGLLISGLVFSQKFEDTAPALTLHSNEGLRVVGRPMARVSFEPGFAPPTASQMAAALPAMGSNSATVEMLFNGGFLRQGGLGVQPQTVNFWR